jgi:hypothetical protein
MMGRWPIYTNLHRIWRAASVVIWTVLSLTAQQHTVLVKASCNTAHLLSPPNFFHTPFLLPCFFSLLMKVAANLGADKSHQLLDSSFTPFI